MTGDCEAYMATTTEDLREATEITNCETFAVESRIFAGGIDDYVTTIGDVETIGNSIAVSTTESYTSQFDARAIGRTSPRNTRIATNTSWCARTAGGRSTTSTTSERGGRGIRRPPEGASRRRPLS